MARGAAGRAWGPLTMKPGVLARPRRRRPTPAPRGSSPISSPRRVRRPPAGRRRALRRCAPRTARVLEQAVLLDGLEHRQRRPRRRPGCRRTSCRGCRARSSVTGRAEADDGADRDAAAEPLRDRDEIGRDVARSWANHSRCGPMPGLHLVEPQQRAVLASRSRGRRPGSRRAARRRLPRPGSARAPPPPSRGRRRRASASASPYGTKVTSTGQRLERLRGRPPWPSARARPWCGRGSRPRRRRAWVRPVRRVSLSAASLASVPELVKKTRPVVGAGQRRAAARPARPAARW